MDTWTHRLHPEATSIDEWMGPDGPSVTLARSRFRGCECCMFGLCASAMWMQEGGRVLGRVDSSLRQRGTGGEQRYPTTSRLSGSSHVEEATCACRREGAMPSVVSVSGLAAEANLATPGANSRASA